MKYSSGNTIREGDEVQWAASDSGNKEVGIVMQVNEGRKQVEVNWYSGKIEWVPFTWLKEKSLQTKALVAVDLHGTIADKSPDHSGEYDPSNYTLQPGAVDALNELRADGHEVAIWTCWATDEAREWLDANGVPYDYVNEEAPDHGSPKIDCDFYVDDKSVFHNGDWNHTLAKLQSRGLAEKSLVKISKASERSQGHIAFIGGWEYYKDPQGNVYRAKESQPVMTDGYRAGRWEAPPHLADQYLKLQGVKSITKPSGTKVDDVYQALLREGHDEGSAARIAQAQTGQALATGKPPKGKAAMEVACPQCSGKGCDFCNDSGTVRVADDKAGGTIMPEGMTHGGIPLDKEVKLLRYAGRSKTGGEIWYRC